MSDGDFEYIPATMCYAAEHETNFAEMDMDTMQGMVKASNPSEVHNVSRGWKDVHDQLVGGSSGGVKGAFDKAVEEVLQHWQGPSAEKFRAQANKISKKISDCSLYADYTSRAMKNAANVLEQLKPEVESMEKPGKVDSAVNWLGDGGSRDDSGLKRDLANPGMTTQQALDNNSGNLSSGKEQQLRMAVKMEQLGAAYVSQAKAMGTWKGNPRVDSHEDYPGPPGGEPPAPIPMPMPSGGGPGPSKVGPPSVKPPVKGPGFSSDGLRPPKTSGISGGIGTQPAKGSYTPDVSTGLDSFQPPKGGGGGASGGIGGGIGGGAGGGLNGGAGGGIGGGAGAGGGGIGGGVGGGMGIAGGGGAGAGARGAGRTGMPGMGGAAGAGKGAGAKGAGGAGRGGALARQKGGVIGAGKGKASGAGQGGSGLHRSRGGAQAGSGAGGRRPAGMAGAPGVHGAKGKEKGQNNGERPDYLVEDEETWTSERNVAPKVIE